MSQEFWLVVGSQHLYGEEALNQVRANAQQVVDTLNKNNAITIPIVFKTLVTTADEITQVMKDANYNDNVLGVITWMHTFSPAKMWIQGTKLLQKPLLHLATQAHKEIPWDTIDMDFMNLNQAAHGDREYGFINARLKKNNKVIVGYYENQSVIDQISAWQTVALGYQASHEVRVARIGDNMRNVAVTEGDKVEAAIQFGWTVDYYGVGDLVEYIEAVSTSEVDALYKEYETLYTLDHGSNTKEHYEAQVKYQAKLEIGLTNFLAAGNYNALTTNFEDLHGMHQLPGLAIQRLNLKGIGFAGEGDWKTAALDRLLKVMSNNKETGFMEDYTYNLTEGNEYILQSHMLEVDPTFAKEKPSIVVSPLGIGAKEDPARLVFDGISGKGIAITMADFGTNYRLLVNEIELIEPTEAAPLLPVARVLWKPLPNFEVGVRTWIELGGGHHTVATTQITSEQMLDLAKLLNLETHLIK